MSALQFDNGSKHYPGGPLALSEVSFNVSAGGMLSVTESSGAGKSTLPKLIYLAQRPSAGEVRLYGRDLISARTGRVRLLRNPVSTLLTMSVMALVLSLPFGLWLGLDNLAHLPVEVERARSIDLFLTTDIDTERARALARHLRALDDVAEVEHLIPEQGMAELRTQVMEVVSEISREDNPFMLQWFSIYEVLLILAASTGLGGLGARLVSGRLLCRSEPGS